MKGLVWQVISSEGLANLAGYGYHGVDNSFFGNLILNRLWNWAVTLAPMWLAPNVITLLGLICNIVAYIVVAVYTPNLVEEAPRWSFFVASFLIFMYQVLDNVDGKQARRTKSSSPLGELFDHGCDALSVALFALIAGGVLRIGAGLTFWLILIGFAPFYLAHWEEYHTGSLVLGAFNGPTEAQLVLIFVLFLTGITGSNIWAYPLGNTGLTTGFLPFILTVTASSFTMCQNILHVVRRPATEAGPAMMQLVPLVTFLVLSIVWTITSLSNHPGVFFHFAMNILGVIFAYLVSRLIVNRICREPVKLVHPILIPLAIVTVLDVVNTVVMKDVINSIVMMYVLFGVSAIIYFYFAISVIIQLCTHLKIRAFVIPYPPPEDVAKPDTSVSVPVEREGLLSTTETHSIE